MDKKIKDNFALAASVIVVSPFILFAFLTLAIGYPLHRLKTLFYGKFSKTVLVIFFIISFAGQAFAINILEKIVYKRDTIKTYKSRILVNPLTNEIKYMWCTGSKKGYWMPLSGMAQKQYQIVYDRERSAK